MNIEKLKETLDTVRVDKNILNEILKDRLDFGFDSIYFRYATVRDELAYLKAMLPGKHDYETEKRRAETDKMHFYDTLEQLVHAHKEIKDNDSNN